jgi:hypothetical protein
MNRHSSTSLSLVLFSVGSHLRAAYKPHANRALEGKGKWTNDDSERLSDHRPVSCGGQITEEVTDAAVAPTPLVTPPIRITSMFERHLLNPEAKETMEQVLFL